MSKGPFMIGKGSVNRADKLARSFQIKIESNYSSLRPPTKGEIFILPTTFLKDKPRSVGSEHGLTTLMR